MAKLAAVVRVYNERNALELSGARRSVRCITLREDPSASRPRSPGSRGGGWRIYAGPTSYCGRACEEGKKIGWRDGARALRCVLSYNLLAG